MCQQWLRARADWLSVPVGSSSGPRRGVVLVCECSWRSKGSVKTGILIVNRTLFAQLKDAGAGSAGLNEFVNFGFDGRIKGPSPAGCPLHARSLGARLKVGYAFGRLFQP